MDVFSTRLSVPPALTSELDPALLPLPAPPVTIGSVVSATEALMSHPQPPPPPPLSPTQHTTALMPLPPTPQHAASPASPLGSPHASPLAGLALAGQVLAAQQQQQQQQLLLQQQMQYAQQQALQQQQHQHLHQQQMMLQATLVQQQQQAAQLAQLQQQHQQQQQQQHRLAQQQQQQQHQQHQHSPTPTLHSPVHSPTHHTHALPLSPHQQQLLEEARRQQQHHLQQLLHQQQQQYQQHQQHLQHQQQLQHQHLQQQHQQLAQLHAIAVAQQGMANQTGAHMPLPLSLTHAYHHVVAQPLPLSPHRAAPPPLPAVTIMPACLAPQQPLPAPPSGPSSPVHGTAPGMVVSAAQPSMQAPLHSPLHGTMAAAASMNTPMMTSGGAMPMAPLSPPSEGALQQEVFESPVSTSTMQWRQHFSSIQKYIGLWMFQLGETLGTGTFGRVRLAYYDPQWVIGTLQRQQVEAEYAARTRPASNHSVANGGSATSTVSVAGTTSSVSSASSSHRESPNSTRSNSLIPGGPNAGGGMQSATMAHPPSGGASSTASAAMTPAASGSPSLTPVSASPASSGVLTSSSASALPAGPFQPARFFALKMLKKSEIIRLKQVEHIRAEKAILSRINHPFIVSLYATFQDQKNVYMVSEYIIGGELFSQLRKVGRFNNDTARFYAAEIVLALQYLHSKDIVYRDLKPENLLVSSDGHIKITDFGFAKVVVDRTWTLCGTPEYLAPEIIQSRGHGKAVDWWALGILIFEMLAGYPPYYDDNPFGIYQKILAGKIEFPRSFDPVAKDLVRRLLMHDRTMRYGCLRDGAEDIKRHKWFKGLDWFRVYTCGYKPPFVPAYRSPGDTSNFDKYPPSAERPAPPLSEKDAANFADF